MSTVINNYKFSHYKFTSERLFSESDLNSEELNWSGQVANIIVADGVTTEEATKMMNSLIEELNNIFSNPWWNHLSIDVVYSYDDMFGFNTIITCDDTTYSFIQGYLMGKG